MPLRVKSQTVDRLSKCPSKSMWWISIYSQSRQTFYLATIVRMTAFINWREPGIQWRHSSCGSLLFRWRHIGPLSLTWINFNPSMECNYIHYKVWHEITGVLIHVEISTVQPLKFGKWLVISSRTLLGYDYLSMLALKLIRVSKRGPSND